MRFLDNLADRRIQEAIEKGELDNLPGAGRAIPEEPELCGVAPEMRVAFRILRNAGYLPAEVQWLREIKEVTGLLQAIQISEQERQALRRWYNLLLQKLGESRAGNLMVQGAYLEAIVKKID